jgi:hypothetical protein
MSRMTLVLALCALVATSACSRDAEWNNNYRYMQFSADPLPVDD